MPLWDSGLLRHTCNMEIIVCSNHTNGSKKKYTSKRKKGGCNKYM